MTDTLDAGDFGAWLTDMRRALHVETDAKPRVEIDVDVPCAGCTACCTASQFVHVDPDETDALAHIPPELLFPAPGLPAGHMVMGHDEQGACPMFVEGACSIYAHRPRACRTYDCRVFAAAGVDVSAADDTKHDVAARVRRWRFSYATPDDSIAHDAVRDAAAFLATHRDELRLTTATQCAVAAVAIADLFASNTPSLDEVRAAMARESPHSDAQCAELA